MMTAHAEHLPCARLAARLLRGLRGHRLQLGAAGCLSAALQNVVPGRAWNLACGVFCRIPPPLGAVDDLCAALVPALERALLP
eukprot:5359461-Prymnesium_polylepis.1